MSAEHDPSRGTGEPGRAEHDPSRGTGETGRAGDDFLDQPLEPPGWEQRPADSETASTSSASEPASAEVGQAEAPPTKRGRSRHVQSPNMLPARETRRSIFERLLVRLIATAGIVGIGVAIAAIMVSSKSQGWVIGLVVSIVTVVLSAVLWSSREL